MATFDADIARICAMELREHMLALYAAVWPIFQETRAWTLNNVDPLLPAPFDVRVQLEAYRTLKIAALKLTAFDALLLTAQVGDTLSYPPPPGGSGLITFNENLIYTDALSYGM
jgi:hypothetical protein